MRIPTRYKEKIALKESLKRKGMETYLCQCGTGIPWNDK